MTLVVKPLKPFSTRKPRMPSSVCAQTIGEIGDRAVGDPHLRAVQHPVLALPARVRLHVRRIGAAVRLGEAEAADDFALAPCAAASAASALRCRTRRSDTCTGSTAPRRSCAGRNRRAPVPGRSGRTTRRSGRRSRSRESSCRAGPARRRRCTSSRGKRSCSKHSPMIGITCSSTNLRDRVLHQPLLVAEHAADVVQVDADRARRRRGSVAVWGMADMGFSSPR